MASITKTFILDRVTIENGCWRWQGPKYKDYGYIGKRSNWAHRIAYELWIGPIPHEHQLDHKCNTKDCINPLHLRPVSRSQNQFISIAHQRGQMSKKTLRVARWLHEQV